MSDEKLTQWFPADVKPARVGVYEKDLDGDPGFYSCWDGNQWCWCRTTVVGAAIDRYASNWQNTPWRGLTKESK